MGKGDRRRNEGGIAEGFSLKRQGRRGREGEHKGEKDEV